MGLFWTVQDGKCRGMAVPEITCDPLKWWKDHQKALPKLAHLARIYLSVPASQASTERSFSIANRVCTVSRCSLTPDHIEKIAVLHQNYELFVDLSDVIL